MPNYTTTELLRKIKQKAFIPENQKTFTDDDLLEMATDEMRSIVVPEVLSTMQEWYVTSTEVDVDSDRIKVPKRAIGGSLREVLYKVGSIESNIPLMSIEDTVNNAYAGSLIGFYFSGSTIKLIGRGSSGSLHLFYHYRPGTLIKDNQAGKILSIDRDTNSVVLDTIPSGWVVNKDVDILESVPHFDATHLENQIIQINGQQVTFRDELSLHVAIGDWVTPEDTSPVPQIPVEWFPYLAQAVAVQVLESLGDSEQANRAAKRRDLLQKNALKVVSPRVEGEYKKAVPAKNRGGSFPYGQF